MPQGRRRIVERVRGKASLVFLEPRHLSDQGSEIMAMGGGDLTGEILLNHGHP
jgi:hypothetical protein